MSKWERSSGDFKSTVELKGTDADAQQNADTVDRYIARLVDSIRELEQLRDYTMRPRILGYDGKWALHPDQVKVINEVFTPTQEQFDRAFDILEAYEKATTEGDRRGAVMFGDEMIDEASRKMALKFVSRGERAGMSRSA